MAESQVALRRVRDNTNAVQTLQYSEATEQRLRKGARLLLDMEQRLMKERQRMQATVLFSEREQNATVVIQQLARGFM